MFYCFAITVLGTIFNEKQFQLKHSLSKCPQNRNTFKIKGFEEKYRRCSEIDVIIIESEILKNTHAVRYFPYLHK